MKASNCVAFNMSSFVRSLPMRRLPLPHKVYKYNNLLVQVIDITSRTDAAKFLDPAVSLLIHQ